jgi:hypothetical protein
MGEILIQAAMNFKKIVTCLAIFAAFSVRLCSASSQEKILDQPLHFTASEAASITIERLKDKMEEGDFRNLSDALAQIEITAKKYIFRKNTLRHNEQIFLALVESKSPRQIIIDGNTINLLRARWIAASDDATQSADPNVVRLRNDELAFVEQHCLQVIDHYSKNVNSTSQP